jgi:hypothetical protein
MRGAFFAAVLIAATPMAAHADDNPFKTAGGIVEVYSHAQQNLTMRMYIRGLFEGMGFYNVAEVKWGHPIFCVPENAGLDDVKLVAIMGDFLKKHQYLASSAPGGVLLFAIQDRFPCKGQ